MKFIVSTKGHFDFIDITEITDLAHRFYEAHKKTTELLEEAKIKLEKLIEK